MGQHDNGTGTAMSSHKTGRRIPPFGSRITIENKSIWDVHNEQTLAGADFQREWSYSIKAHRSSSGGNFLRTFARETIRRTDVKHGISGKRRRSGLVSRQTVLVADKNYENALDSRNSKRKNITLK